MLRMFFALTFVVLACFPAEAKRVALVIGNNDYPNLPAFRQLKKAVNDARSMRDTLQDDLGFQVNFAENVDFRAMNNGFKSFEATIEQGDIVFLYFSGHGVSIGGENYLLPSDIPVPVSGEEQRLIGSSFGAEQLVLRLKKRGAKAVFTVLDACRDDPFEAENGKAIGGPAGLTKMDAAEGVFILFAAGVRQTALDRISDDDDNPNSVFTRSLIPALKTEGLSQIDLAKRVYKEVKVAAAKIGHDQTPAYYDQIDGYVMLKEKTITDEVAVTPPPPPPAVDPVDPAKQAFEAAGDNADMLRVVAETYPDTVWAKLATAKLAKPEEKQVAMIDPVQPLNVEPVVKLKPKSATSKPLTGKAKTLRAAADNGDVNAMFELGGMFFKGKGAPKDKAEAAFWFAKVAEAGDARGMNRLGDIYLTGEGVERDWTQSAAWYRKSADMGDAAGIGKLAGSYLNGEGVDKDEVEAMRLYRQAAEAGNIDAMYNLEAFLREGIGGQKDPGEAAQWVKRIRAAEAKKQ